MFLQEFPDFKANLLFFHSLGRHDRAHGLVHGLDDPRFDELLQELDGLIPRHVAVEVGILLEVSVQPLDGLGPGEAVVVDSHVSAEKER